MKRKSPVTFPSPVVNSTAKDNIKVELCGKKYELVLDLQAVGMIIQATGRNILIEGVDSAWLFNPKNMKATLRAALQRVYGEKQPSWEQLQEFITVRNVLLVVTALQTAYDVVMPTEDELRDIGIDVDALKRAREKALAEGKEPLPPTLPVTSGSDSGPSDEAIYE